MENEKAKVEMVKFSVPRLTDKELDNMQFMLIEKIGLLCDSVLHEGEPLYDVSGEITECLTILKKLNLS
tara:strand:- start:34 stop:240 length:207 start_codon:yes stop_codon:yes gene_type:complete